MKTVEELLKLLEKLCYKITLEFSNLGVWIITTHGNKGKHIVSHKELNEAVVRTYQIWK